MIRFFKKAVTVENTSRHTDLQQEPKPSGEQPEENRFEQIRRRAAAGHKKSDTDGAVRRARQTIDDNRLL